MSMGTDHESRASRAAGPGAASLASLETVASDQATDQVPSGDRETFALSTRNGTGRYHTVAAIPAYDEALTIASVVLLAKGHVDHVVVVDDGSRDATAEVASLAGATVLSHARNEGKGAAVRTAFEWARAHGVEALVLLDGDMQHDPREIPEVLEPILDGRTDMALGFRSGEGTEMPVWRRFGKRVLDYATAAGSRNVTDSQCGYRAFGPKAIEALALREGGFGIESEMLLEAREKQLSFEEVAVTCRYDGIDGSTKGPVTHALGVLRSLLRMVTEREPLVYLGVPAFLATITGILLGMWVLYVLEAAGELAVGTAILSSMLILAGLFTGLAAVIFHTIPRAVAAELGSARARVHEATGEDGSPRRGRAFSTSVSLIAASGLEPKP